MLVTTTNCIVCHNSLTSDSSESNTENFINSFDTFCKFLDLQLVNESWNLEKENRPLCDTCAAFVEEVADLLETIYSQIKTVINKTGDFVKLIIHHQQETNVDSNYSDERVQYFRDQLIKSISVEEALPNTHETLQKFVSRKTCTTKNFQYEQDDDEEDEEYGDDFFDSFVSRNVEQLQFEESITLQQQMDTCSSKDYDSGSDYMEVGGSYDSGNEGLTDDDELIRKRINKPGPKCSKVSATRELSARAKLQLSDHSDGGYTYGGFAISKVDGNIRCMDCPQKDFKMISEAVGHIEHDHLGNKSKRKVYPCQICGQMLPRKKLKFHNESHDNRRNKLRHKCKICSTISTSLEESKQHQADKHSDVHAEALLEVPPLPPRVLPSTTRDGNLNYMGFDIIAESDKAYRCALCPQKGPYTSRKMILNHIRELHINPPKEGKQMYHSVPITVRNGIFSCDLCPDRAPYRLKRSLISHIKDKHLERDKPWLKCEFCSKEYRTLTMLNIHRKTHQNSSYHWFCDSCGKFFNSEVILRHHKKQVHEKIIPEKKFVCTYAGCDKKYVNEKLLEIHFRLHTGELPFKCDYCDKRFRQEKLKMVHFRRKHAEETPFKCNFCSEAFHDSSFVQSHLKSKHPEVTDRRKGLAYQVIYNIRPVN